jgi:hypothetical protein
MGQVNLSKTAHAKLDKIKALYKCSGSDAILFLYEKYLFFEAEKQNGNTNTDKYE